MEGKRDDLNIITFNTILSECEMERRQAFLIFLSLSYLKCEIWETHVSPV